jgi:predicted small lipoprotein YifL
MKILALLLVLSLAGCAATGTLPPPVQYAPPPAGLVPNYQAAP